METRQADLAYGLANTDIPVPDSFDRRESRPLFKAVECIRSPAPLERRILFNWKFLMELPEHWDWLAEIFGSTSNFKAAIDSYYMFLNVIEFFDAIDRGSALSAVEKIELSVPLCFAVAEEGEQRKAMRHFKDCVPFIAKKWSARIGGTGSMTEKWNQWVEICDQWVSRFYPWSDNGIPHRDLPQLIAAAPVT